MHDELFVNHLHVAEVIGSVSLVVQYIKFS